MTELAGALLAASPGLDMTARVAVRGIWNLAGLTWVITARFCLFAGRTRCIGPVIFGIFLPPCISILLYGRARIRRRAGCGFIF
jgi:hypothetical protein